MAKGKKTGGRQKGTPNKVTARMREEIAASGEMPIEYMIRVMRDGEVEQSRRDDMARAAAPYFHPRLSSVDQTVDDKRQHVIADKPLTSEEWEEKYCDRRVVEEPVRMVGQS